MGWWKSYSKDAPLTPSEVMEDPALPLTELLMGLAGIVYALDTSKGIAMLNAETKWRGAMPHLHTHWRECP